MIRKKVTFAFLTLLLTVSLIGCSNPQVKNDPVGAVVITDKGTHFSVTLDYSKDISRRELGKAYGEAILAVSPNYEEILEDYIGTFCINDGDYEEGLRRVNILLDNIPNEYREEIAGLGEAFSGGTVNVLGDGKASVDEVFIFNLLTDVIRGTECSGVGAYGNATDDGQPIVARLLDWDDGDGLLLSIESVTTLRQGDESLCLIGYLGHLGMLSAVNDNGVFAGILDSSTGAPYSIEGKRSYVMDLRWAMEQYSNLDDIAAYLADSSRDYCFNHNVFFADTNGIAVLENNISGNGYNMHRALRYDDSVLNPGVEWDHDNAICVAGSFVLEGNHDNHNGFPWIIRRWESYDNSLTNSGSTVDWDELKAMATDSDVFGDGCQFLIVFKPTTMKLEVIFKPTGGGTGSFETISIDF